MDRRYFIKVAGAAAAGIAISGCAKTRDTRRWMDEKGITEHHVSCVEKDWVLV